VPSCLFAAVRCGGGIFSALARQPAQNRAVGPLVALAAAGQPIASALLDPSVHNPAHEAGFVFLGLLPHVNITTINQTYKRHKRQINFLKD
jgi:hypothetical protein